TILIGSSSGSINSLATQNNSTLVTNSSGSVYWSTVAPSSTSFSNIITGLNNSASMTVATGASINLQGTGQVQASEFYGTGSTTSMVDLATGEVAGILPVTKGGTGSSNTFGPNTILIGTSAGTITSMTSLNNATLVTNSSGSVYWSTAGASSTSFSNLLGGTNTSASMTVGSGASLNVITGGVIQANQFIGTGSTSNAVDLATSEVSGILPTANGGTGSSSSFGTNTILMGSSGGTITSLPSATNSYLITNSSGSVYWSPLSTGTVGGSGATNQVAYFSNSSTLSSSASFTWDNSTQKLVLNGSSTFLGPLAIGNSTSKINSFLTGSSQTANLSYTLPTAQGAVSSYLQNDGSGNLSWSTISAGSTSFSQIIGNTNSSSTMTVGSGAALLRSGTGIVEATEFYGTGSVTDQVDLGTAEVAGILPVTKGGTGSSNTFGPNTILIGSSAGTVTALTSINSAALVTNASGSVYWSTAGGSLSGSGATDRVAYFNSGNTLSGVDNFMFNAGSNRLSLTGQIVFNSTVISPTPDPSAILDIQSTTKGFLLPRMTNAQRNAITAPVDELFLFNSTNQRFEYNSGNASTPVWTPLMDSISLGSYGWKLIGNAATTPGTNFIGTTDAQDLVFKTNATERLRIEATGTVNISSSSATTGATKLAVQGNIFLSGPSGTASELRLGKPGDDTKYVGFRASSTTTGATTYTWPAADGSASSYLATDGAGNLSWSTITPGSVSFSQIMGNTNSTSTMTVGTGAAILPSGSGIIKATDYTGPGSTTDDIDLATAEVAGILPTSKGGTGSSASFGTGTVLIGTSSGTVGQLSLISSTTNGVLTSTSSGSIYWSSVINPASVAQGAGGQNQIAYFNAAGSLTSSTFFTADDVSKTMTLRGDLYDYGNINMKASSTVSPALLKFEKPGDETKYIALRASDTLSTSVTYQLPGSPASTTTTNFLASNTSGQMYWASPSAIASEMRLGSTTWVPISNSSYTANSNDNIIIFSKNADCTLWVPTEASSSGLLGKVFYVKMMANAKSLTVKSISCEYVERGTNASTAAGTVTTTGSSFASMQIVYGRNSTNTGYQWFVLAFNGNSNVNQDPCP
ncbi:MAG: hypothetical protein NT007_11730, partial [Candidatus Kapabacteria bacterium]|nr:hypothetical protein [Candidatus Kapabacteria bacterium]